MQTSRSSFSPSLIARLMAFVSLCFWQGTAQAVAHPLEGDWVGELAFQAAGLELVREQVTLDMREMAQVMGLVSVRTRYVVRNRGAAQVVQLTAPKGALLHGLEASVHPLPVSQGDQPTTPRAAVNDSGSSVLSLSLPSGEIEITLSFLVQPKRWPLREVTGYGVEYDLRSGRAWAGSGSLMLQLLVPASFTVVEYPLGLTELAEGTYRATFDTYPGERIRHTLYFFEGDYGGEPERLSILIQPPLWPYYVLSGVLLAALLAAWGIAAFAAPRLSRRRALSGAGLSLRLTLASAAVCSLLVLGLPAAALLGGRLYPHVSDFRWAFFLLLTTWTGGILLCWWRHIAVYRHSKASFRT